MYIETINGYYGGRVRTDLSIAFGNDKDKILMEIAVKGFDMAVSLDIDDAKDIHAMLTKMIEKAESEASA